MQWAGGGALGSELASVVMSFAVVFPFAVRASVGAKSMAEEEGKDRQIGDRKFAFGTLENTARVCVRGLHD